MNGRVYDFNNGRFLNVDPFIQNPGSTQSLNPYTYVFNNPLSGVDPSGYNAEGLLQAHYESWNLGQEVRAANLEGSRLAVDAIVGAVLLADELSDYLNPIKGGLKKIAKEGLKAGIKRAKAAIRNGLEKVRSGALKQSVKPSELGSHIKNRSARSSATQSTKARKTSHKAENAYNDKSVQTQQSTARKGADAAEKGITKSAFEMADDLANQIGKNSVQFRTPNKTGHVDLRGRSHFDKRTQTEVPTPHVQTRDIKVGPNGQISAPRKTEITRPATKQDIRSARELERRRGLFP